MTADPRRVDPSRVRAGQHFSESEYLGRLRVVDGAPADARRLTQRFNVMVRDPEGEKLDA